ncbi:MAG: globin domain-containing protein [Gammaproteobacteria bacterium]|nr:globin domain-containing protein [Gammaproteobacteria bacterium]
MQFVSRRTQSVKVQETAIDADLLEKSFTELSQQGGLLVSRFYEELFKRYPDVKPLFSNTSIAEQQQKLLAAIKLVVANIRDPQALKNVLVKLGERHRGYGAQPEHYKAVKATLLDVMKELSGASWSESKRATWDNALQVVASTMLKADGNG